MSQKKELVDQIKDRDYWVEVIRRYQSSGLVQKVFCAREGVAFGSFKTWLYRLKAEESKSSSSHSPFFVPIVVEQEPPGSPPITPCESPLILELADQIRIVVTVGFGEETLRRLIHVVRGTDV